MRTTLTIDDTTMKALKDAARRSGKTLGQIVNETLRAGLRAGRQADAKPYRLKPVRLGQLRAGIDLDKALSLAERLEADDDFNRFAGIEHINPLPPSR